MKRLEELQGYLGGELTDAEADAFEEAMFDAPDDPDVVFVDRIARLGKRLVKHGTFDIGVTKAHIDKLRTEGHNIQLLDAGEPCTKIFTIEHASEFIASRFVIGRTDLDRVDVEITIPAYNATKVIREVIVDRDGCVYGLCERPLAEIAIGAATVTRIRECSGARTVIAEWHLTSVAAA